MSAKVTVAFKRDFDYCMAHWKSLKDGFTDDDVTEARSFARMIIQEGDKASIAEMERWFAQEVAKIRAIQEQASGITERIKNMRAAA